MEEMNPTQGFPQWRTNLEGHSGHFTACPTEDELCCVGKLKDLKGARPTRADNMNI